ncbi:MAG: radical SAM family heme chaperone HemW [Gammaproteobacteria bacterium]|nr:radical SAM family heme chaperone HemW [Gammaproteobacteria bacterium]MBU1653791.1 radical SAM family heme chaperone HemW [Gammaproteobacteria bacterium]MBU1961703.1 radical SAM family heme chaperone HemW [Gammaproteobacteria bacterium]
MVPPLSLYIHFPWCVRKCPYCDFNSHVLSGDVDVVAYLDALIDDFSHQYSPLGQRPIETIFIGGGTPSLLPGPAIRRLLQAIREMAPLAGNAEISLEANPGAAEADHFADYRDSGVNRLSIGAQSFNDKSLHALGRIHSREETLRAFLAAREAGFNNINLDLMFGLPRQPKDAALFDLRMALELGPEHLSWYQLSLEPNTPFSRTPPALPDEDSLYAIQEGGLEYLAAGGMERYEISAFSRPGMQCRHNLNYWRFGDYLGIGAGSHGKVTDANGQALRYWKAHHPRRYMASPTAAAGRRQLDAPDLVIEFMMNALRLKQGFDLALFEARTGLATTHISETLRTASERGLLELVSNQIRATELGFRFLNDLIGLFDHG